MALLGTDDEREAMRREVDRQHRQVRSLPGDPVPDRAFDTDLQLWVAACLYQGTQDIELEAVGFLPERFRAELGLPWSPRHQRAFDALMSVWATVDRRLPGPVRRFPFNAYLWDTPRRIRRGIPIVSRPGPRR